MSITQEKMRVTRSKVRVSINNGECIIDIIDDLNMKDLIASISNISAYEKGTDLQLPDSVNYNGRVLPITEIRHRAFSYTSPPVNRLIIPEGISFIEPYAFSSSSVNTVVWPSTCHGIPLGCFFCSTISTIEYDVKSIKWIGSSAFSCSNLADFSWPLSRECGQIPRECFMGTKIQSFKIEENVKALYANAFDSCKIAEGKIDCKCCDHLLITGAKDQINNLIPLLSVGIDTVIETKILDYE